MSELTQIGMVLVKIDLRYRHLVRLYLEKKLTSVEFYTDACKLIEDQGTSALGELSDLMSQRYNLGPGIRLESLYDLAFAPTEEERKKAYLRLFRSDSAEASNSQDKMRTMQLMDIGMMLIEAGIEEDELTSLLLKNQLTSGEVYRVECNRLKELRNRASLELHDLIKRRYWCRSKMKLGSLCDPVCAATKESEARAGSKPIESNNAHTSNSRGQQR